MFGEDGYSRKNRKLSQTVQDLPQTSCSWVQANLWAIHRNEREFPEPDRFNPERYLNPRPAYPNSDGYNTFGFGRRVCSGKALAEQGIFIVSVAVYIIIGLTCFTDCRAVTLGFRTLVPYKP